MQRPTKKRRADEPLPSRNEGDAASDSARQAAGFDAERMQQQLELFVLSGDVDSAQILGELLVSVALVPSDSEAPSSRNDARPGSDESFLSRRYDKSVAAAASDARRLSPAFHAKTLRLFADLMLAKREFKRAIRYYYHSCRGTSVVTNEQELEVKLKVARCYVQLGRVHEAIEVLKSTAPEGRSLSMNLLLAKLYVNEGLPNKAEESYTAALRQNPYALEAVLALTELAAAKDASPDAFAGSDGGAKAGEGVRSTGASVRQHEIERFYTDFAAAPRAAGRGLSQVDVTWMQKFVAAHMDAERGNYRTAVNSFNAVDRVFPKNLYCLLRKAALEVDQELIHQAHVTFKRARQVDDLNLSYMDCYANCLRKGNSRTNLNDLVQELFQISSTCAESWLAAAYYNDVKGDHETALQFSERAIAERHRHAPAHLLRGEVLLRMHRPQPALKAFWTACRLTRSLEAYTGIITSYCDLYAVGVNRFKEAFATAKSVVRLFPQKAQSFVLFGSVLALSSEHREQARQALQKALSMEPRKLSTNFALADLLVEEGDLRGAIDRLHALGERHPREEVFSKLAFVYSMDKQYAEALKYFHQALRLNPGSTEALQGLDRLEKLMRGEDPDELSNSMEQMEEQEESTEASEYLSP
ncbi:Anaphase promoting complex subunit 7 [Phytophthora pseudosyringae]|uniref:Anaphase promoting complex subunit 7 n=1 Tax=Phytophthora pseudosyringae TaxID=221518 RepID=A0A8T1VXC0_9STRA|nr:Anaphase promoting complex subunit 7 [Phytophthora pseudosyringae]